MSDRERHESRLVKVLSTNNLAQLVVAKSLLEAAGIDYTCSGEPLQPLLADVWAEIRVRDEEETRAKEVLREISDPVHDRP